MTEQTRELSMMNRRRFVVGATVLIASTGAWSTYADDSELPHVTEDDPTAKALKYVHDASKADASLRKEGSVCHNCQLYTGAADAEWGPCSLFPGKAVAGKGWCSAWAARPSG